MDWKSIKLKNRKGLNVKWDKKPQQKIRFESNVTSTCMI